MTDYQVVSKTRHHAQKWKRYTNYLFAGSDPVAEIAFEEVDRAALRYPLAFIKTDSGFRLAVVLGLEPGQNLYVDRQGIWSVDYVPAVYRAYPFALMTDGSEQHVVCIDVDSGLADASAGEDYFDENGEPSASLDQIIQFLVATENGLQKTRKICDSLDKLGLIEPWPLSIKFESDERTISDLYRINVTRLNELEPAVLAELRNSGVLKLVYAQSISIQNMYTLGKLFEQASLDATSQFGKPDSKELQFLNDDGAISFDQF
mgnify:CR=1 FL=1